MYPYIPNTPKDIEEMLSEMKVKNIEDLFSDIPENIKIEKLNLEKAKSELEVTRYITDLARKNRNLTELTNFLGAGAYDRYIPSVVKHLASRSEFYTAYTPYQPEISQGTLQVIFEYQSMMCELTGMDVANASLYDGATACVEAAFMASSVTKRNKVLVSETVHPETRKVLKTYLRFKDIEMVELECKNGSTDLEEIENNLDKDTAAVILQNPNFFGIVENHQDIIAKIKAHKSLFILSTDPISLALLKSPGELGVDIVVGEGQSLGNPLNFGGPYLGFLATTKKLMRKIPGRIVGQSIDTDNKRAFVLTLQAREQHIRRFKATSNICSNQALNALIASVYLVTMGKKGIKEVAYQSVQKAHYAYDEISKLDKFKPTFKDQPFFYEFAINSDLNVDKINSSLLEKNILGGYPLQNSSSKYANDVLYCVTEKRTKEEIDTLVSALEVIS
ncbi:glycine dehydrogenase (decarboxylating) alpha subunit [Desulfonispora thiosulfatigenes DSM 11270]|uniref:Probable glycine dehydrogenase (decarboxylating) subunit 1 n=1 Tax=Desulfonispora thiosulfatigenes DSM 11270 TaxID=656914 RepID=A0A1W1ULP9_DESTI|nr:aminomethyl-transferring glycine dehydrogenase subunit GcvPA [Desulfonispora thiosulfatigenes]SMB81919.1 glycine dehydrogenase (decarboxylating) alpha subunit [Desulfonispora thiosulfatigenes DSM 11270]